MDSKLILPACLLVFLAILPTGSGLKCHQCSSHEDAKCKDPFYYEDNKDKPKTMEYLKECPNDGKEYFCRKIYQNVRGEERVIRSCGYEQHDKDKDCYSTVLEEYNTYVCKCDTEGCNTASMFQISSLALLSTVLLACVLQ